tara:strand:- start:4140 stop:5153 length:1014 start_codon:yes stop_codon:yes gene_type:complete
MAINFPINPNTNDTFTVLGITWRYDGTSWRVSSNQTGNQVVGYVGVSSNNTSIGTSISTLNFLGIGNTFALSGDRVDVSIRGEGAGIASVRPDNESINWGDNNELKILHTTGGQSVIRSDDISIQTAAGTNIIQGIGNTASLLFNGSKKLETTNLGVKIIGGIEDSNGLYGPQNYYLQSTGTGIQWAAVSSGGGSGSDGYFAKTTVGINTVSNVGIGTTNPETPLQINNVYGVNTGVGTFIAVVGSAHTVDTFSPDTFKTAEYTLHIENDSNIQSQKVSVMHNTTTAYSAEYAVMYEPNLIVSVAATVSNNNCELWLTPETGMTGLTTFRFTRDTMI